MANQNRVVHCDPEILGGTPVFVGTRVPVQDLFDSLKAGDRLEDFLKSFPSVTREQAITALKLGFQALEARADSTIRDSIADTRGALPVTEAQRVELDRRLADHLQDPSATRPWPKVRDDLKRKK
jgi:putative addiction module component (TIGR02574 family)